VAEKERTPQEELEVAAVRVVTALSERNLKNGDTYTVTVPRSRIQDLHAALETLYPGWVERIYRRKEQERAAADN
jgi:hypothetical protein